MFDDSTPDSTEWRVEEEQVAQLLSFVRQLGLKFVTRLLPELLHSLTLVVQSLARCEDYCQGQEPGPATKTSAHLTRMDL